MKRLVLFFCLATLVSGVGAATEYRDFTSADGKTIRGAVVAYDAKSKMVTIERDNRRTSKVPITVFSEADQEYISTWKNQEGVRSSSKFKISCDRRNVKDWNETKRGTINYSDGSVEHDQVTGKISFQEIGYDIIFANRNAYALTDLILEYCIYYEQDGERGKAEQGVLFGDLTIDKLAPSERKNITTDSVVVFKDESNADFLNSRVYKGKVFGISMRVYLLEGEKKTLVREVAVPDTIPSSYGWVSKSKPVGYNK